MHWTLAELRAISPNEYVALVDWLNTRERRPDTEPEPEEEPHPWA